MEVQETAREKEEDTEESFWCSSRFAVMIMGFFGFLYLHALWVDMSVAIVCMTSQDNQVGIDSNTSKDSNAANVNVSRINGSGEYGILKESKQDDKFDWDKRTQGIILGSFFLGYILTQIPGGWLAGRYGGKLLFGGSILISAVASFLTPLAARTHVILLIGLRAVAGICQGVVLPSMLTLLSYWIPPLQRSISVGFVFAGIQVGVMASFPLCGFLCVEGFDGGWPSIFYVLGCIGVVCFLAWMYFVYNSPMTHPRITIKERTYIENTLKSELDFKENSFSTPWSKILASMPVWAIIVTQTCAEWGLYTFLTNIPTYMEEILKFDIKKAGVLASLPYLGFWIVSNISARLADYLRKRDSISTTVARKLFNSIGNIIPAICIAIMGNVADDPDIAVALLILGVAISGCQYGSGFMVNPIDIAPRYAGIVLAISNTSGSLGGFFAPFAISIITKDKTREQWKTVFYIASAVYAFGAVFYLIFGSGKVQSWAIDKKENCTVDAIDGIETRTVEVIDGNGNRTADIIDGIDNYAVDVTDDERSKQENGTVAVIDGTKTRTVEIIDGNGNGTVDIINGIDNCAVDVTDDERSKQEVKHADQKARDMSVAIQSV